MSCTDIHRGCRRHRTALLPSLYAIDESARGIAGELPCCDRRTRCVIPGDHGATGSDRGACDGEALDGKLTLDRSSASNLLGSNRGRRGKRRSAVRASPIDQIVGGRTSRESEFTGASRKSPLSYTARSVRERGSQSRSAARTAPVTTEPPMQTSQPPSVISDGQRLLLRTLQLSTMRRRSRGSSSFRPPSRIQVVDEALPSKRVTALRAVEAESRSKGRTAENRAAMSFASAEAVGRDPDGRTHRCGAWWTSFSPRSDRRREECVSSAVGMRATLTSSRGRHKTLFRTRLAGPASASRNAGSSRPAALLSLTRDRAKWTACALTGSAATTSDRL
jgi:hypothetical protein